MTTEPWISQTVRLKFRIGEWTLFSASFSFLVLDLHFTKLSTDPQEPRVDLDELPKGLDGALIRSHPLDQPLPPLSKFPRAIRYVPEHYEHCYVDLQGTFEAYLRGFSSKSRSTLMRKVRKFSEYSGGRLSWREFRTQEEMKEFYRLAREVSKKTYQERVLNTGLPDSAEFERRMSELAARDSVRGYVLFHQAVPIAYLYCPVSENIMLYQYLGYDPEFRTHSPGTVLQYLVLERLFEEGRFKMFDFTEGQGSQKEFFATGSVSCADIYYFRRNMRNCFLLRLHRGLDAFSAAMVGLLDRLGLKARIKRLVRSK